MTRTFAILLSLLTTTCAAADTVTVRNSISPNLIPLSGTVAAIDSATVSAQTPGKITSLNFDVNDIVQRGQVVLTIDDAELRAKLGKAEGMLAIATADNERAEAEFQRFQDLSGQSYVSAEELARKQNLVKVSRAQVAASQAQIAEITKQLEYTRIIAPYTGVMTARHVNLGESVTIGQPLVSGRALNNNRVVVHVPVGLLDSVGDNPQFSMLDSEGVSYALDDVTVFPDVDPATRTVTVWASLSNDIGGIRPGAFITVYLAHGETSQLLVPRSAVFAQGDLSLVFVIQGEQKLLRQVRLGAVAGEQVEVLSGLQEGETLLADASAEVAGSGI